MNPDADAERRFQFARQFPAENVHAFPHFEGRLQRAANGGFGRSFHPKDAHNAITGNAGRMASLVTSGSTDRSADSLNWHASRTVGGAAMRRNVRRSTGPGSLSHCAP